MSNKLVFLRYAITGLIAYISLDDVGPLAGLIIFVVANVLWTMGEDSLANANNVRQTEKWRRNNK